jgi:uncharacterized protein YndB with AHSA1/START domain
MAHAERLHSQGGCAVPPRCSPLSPEPFDCEVLEVDPPRRLRTRWFVRNEPTIVTFELRADDGGTVLRVEHEGLPTSERPKFDGGWGAKFTIDLRDVLNGARDPAAATRDETGLTHHPAYVSSR